MPVRSALLCPYLSVLGLLVSSASIGGCPRRPPSLGSTRVSGDVTVGQWTARPHRVDRRPIDAQRPPADTTALAVRLHASRTRAARPQPVPRRGGRDQRCPST